MKRLILAAALVSCTGVMALGAQQPVGRMGPGPMPSPGMPGPGTMGGGAGGALDDPAQFLLAHTGELNLTDAQVTRLAAIARRSAERRRSLRAQMDSLRPQPRTGTGARPDSAARAQMRQQMQQRFQQMQPAMQRLREQSLADRRDAIAVLTPDQQALAWERIAAGGRMRARMGRGMGGGFGPRRGMGGPMPGARLRQRGFGPGMGPRRMRPPADDTGPNTDRRRPAPQRRPDTQQDQQDGR